MPSYTIRNKTYGQALVGTTVYYRGFPEKPRFLKPKGQGFPGGKHLLETLGKKYRKFKLILHPTKDEIKRNGSRVDVIVSVRTLRKIDGVVRSRSRDLRLEAAIEGLSFAFPGVFSTAQRVETYRKGMLSGLLTDLLDPRSLSSEDQRAVTSYAAKIAITGKGTGVDERELVKRKHSVQLLHLKNLIAEFEKRLTRTLSENEWQSYFDEKILFFQDNYIRKIPKINIATVTTQFPDFGVITADEYLDLIEIKLPRTPLLREDKSHKTFYWSPDISKAIAQVETYLESVTTRKSDLILQIEKITGLKLRIMKPRGIIIAGSTSEFSQNGEKRDFFRLLNDGLKNVEVVPYDELANRLKNTVISIEKLEAAYKGGLAKSGAAPRG
ncbi:MAG TPA: Shedu immune nuclease family protein [Pseudolabrys sp.]|nr:Shedu immune nuclease family protein [Pseudolabrys sp.]